MLESFSFRPIWRARLSKLTVRFRNDILRNRTDSARQISRIAIQTLDLSPIYFDAVSEPNLRRQLEQSGGVRS